MLETTVVLLIPLLRINVFSAWFTDSLGSDRLLLELLLGSCLTTKVPRPADRDRLLRGSGVDTSCAGAWITLSGVETAEVLGLASLSL